MNIIICGAYGFLQSSARWKKPRTHTKHTHHHACFLDMFITIQYSQIIHGLHVWLLYLYCFVNISSQMVFLHFLLPNGGIFRDVLRSFRRRMTEASLEWPHVEVAQVRLSLWRSLATTSRRQGFSIEVGQAQRSHPDIHSNYGSLITVKSSSLIKVQIQWFSNGSWWISFFSLFSTTPCW